MSFKKGDIILVDNCLIGVIRYNGFVQNLSRGKYDYYLGIEIKYQSNNETIGIVTDGTWSGKLYFQSVKAKGRFVKERMVTKKYTCEELFDKIANQTSLLPSHQQEEDIKEPVKQKQKQTKPKPKPKPQPEPEPVIIKKKIIKPDDDVAIVAQRIKNFCSNNEMNYFINFCKEEDFDLDNIQDDLDAVESDDSLIIEQMKHKFGWNDNKITQFIHLALNRKHTPGYNNIQTPSQNIPKQPIKVNKYRPHIDKPQDIKDNDEPYTIQYDLAKVWEFTVPIDIMRKKDERSIKDIVMCLKKNNISKEAVDKFEMFCRSEKYKFIDFEINLTEIRNKFKQKHRDLIVFMDYIDKCIYELLPPVFKGKKFTKKDEDDKHAYFERQCKGVIKHDKDLLQYFCITEHTEKSLPSELIDIADRIAIEEKQELNITQFGKKYFFKHCDKMQISKVKSGLRKYHSRFLPLFPKNPLKQVADKISGYQKYCILLSHVVTEVEKQITSGYNRYNKDNELLIPYMIDMMILPPGCFNKVEDANSKPYDCEGPEKIGSIEKRLKDFNIPIMKTRGLTDKPKNFNPDIIEGIARDIIKHIREITNNFSKKNQRICIVIDRRWRIKGEKFRAYKKLRDHNSIGSNGNNNDTEGSTGKKHGRSGSWITKGLFGGGSDGYEENKTVNKDFYNSKYDTIYVYQPNLTRAKKKSYHEFNRNYCHETLIYLTKQCIIPRRDTYMHIGGDTTDGWLFNISAHIQIPNNKLWYKYSQRWYVFLQSAALRFFPSDMDKLWPKYFVDVSEDNERLTNEQIKGMFKINLEETDAAYKRWYYAIKRSD